MTQGAYEDPDGEAIAPRPERVALHDDILGLKKWGDAVMGLFVKKSTAAFDLSSNLFAVSYECFLRDCPHCKSAIPIDGPISQVECPECRSEVSIPAEIWDSLYRRASLDWLLSGKFKVTEPLQIDDPQSRFKLEVSRTLQAEPCCIQCGATAPAQRLTSSSDCAGCGTRISFVPLQNNRKGIEVTHVCATALDGAPADATPVDPPQTATPVAMACPLCSANLQVTADSLRTITCEYCSGSIFLPDALWRRFHPVKTARRWMAVHRVNPEAFLARAKHLAFIAPLLCVLFFGSMIGFPSYYQCIPSGIPPAHWHGARMGLIVLLVIAAVAVFGYGLKQARPYFAAARRFRDV